VRIARVRRDLLITYDEIEARKALVKLLECQLADLKEKLYVV
jgi:hypothetical protein